MQRRVSLGKLRGQDPITLEVTITEALRRPMSQLDAAALVDLLALAESPDAPKARRRDLAAFKQRMEHEVGDLPDGHVWNDLIEEIAELEPARVSAETRALFSRVARAEGRLPSSAEALAPLEAAWAEQEPVPFPVGGNATKVEKHRVMNQSEPLTNRKGIGIASKKKKTPRRRSVGTGNSGAPNRRAAPPNNPIDIDKLEYLVQLCMERLSRYGDKGLGESILMVGVRKKAEGEYPTTSGKDVQAALEHLEGQGKIKKSAGRWMVKPRW